MPGTIIAMAAKMPEVILAEYGLLNLNAHVSITCRYAWYLYSPPPHALQADVYQHCVAPLVSACLEGYNATVFAYGQTGSGKSHTMGSEDGQGGGARGDGQGIIPRALEEIFGHIQVGKHYQIS